MKKILIKITSLLLVLFVGISLTACGKSNSNYNTNVPYGSLSNEATYATLNDIKLTQTGLYDQMRSNAYTYFKQELVNLIIKPSDYNLSTETNKDELIEIINEKCYGQKDISDLSTSSKKTSVKKFIDTMALLNITVTEDNIYTEDALNYYLNDLAQKYYAESTITDPESKYYYGNQYIIDEDGNKTKNTYYIDDKTLEDKYNSSFKTDVPYKVIVVGYATMAEAEKAVAEENLDTASNLEQAFTNLYKKAYPYKSVDFNLNDDDMSGYNSSLKTLISNMKAGEYKLYQQFGDYTYNVYLIAEKDTVNYSEITEDKKNEVRDSIIDDFVTSSFITSKVSELLNDSNITVYDPVFDALLANDCDNHKRLQKSAWKSEYNSLVATINDKNLTVDDFYQTLEKILGVTCSMDYFTNKTLLESSYAEKLTDDDIKTIKKNYQSAIDSFKKGSYATNGYPTSIGEDNFKFLYYGTTNYDEIISFYKAQKIWDYAIADYPDNFFDILETFSKQYSEAYFSLSVKHVLVFVDYDMDGTPDDPDLFKNKLSVEDQTKLDEAIVKLMNAIVQEANYIAENYDKKLDEALSSDIVENFYANKALYSDSTKTWADYKEFNLGVKVEDLSEVNNTNASSYVTEFGDGVKALYNELKAESKLKEDYLVDKIENIDNLIKTVYGYHVLCSYGSTDITSAKYTADDDSSKQYDEITVKWKDEDVKLTAYSDNEYASKNQLQIYAAELNTSDGVTHLPTAVKNYIAKFYSTFKTRYESTTFQNILLAEKQLKNINFTDSANTAKFNNFIEIQKRQFDSYSNDYQEDATTTFAGWWNLFAA